MARYRGFVSAEKILSELGAEATAAAKEALAHGADDVVAEAKKKYEDARQKYATFSDANQDVILQELQSQRDDLENDMQLKFNAYSALSTQLQNAQAKLQEHTPSFTIVQSASVPVKPAGPKRMAFVFIVVFLSMMVTFVICNFSLLFGGAKGE